MYIALRFSKEISWKISKDDPKFWEIEGIHSIKMLDPALVSYLSKTDEKYPFGKGTGQNHIFEKYGNHYALNTDLVFVYDNEEDGEKIEETFLKILSKAAFDRRQFGIARPRYDTYMSGTGDLESNQLEISLPTLRVKLPKFLLDTAISYDDLQKSFQSNGRKRYICRHVYVCNRQLF